MDFKLQGKTAIITGGNGGIGRGLTLGFAAEGCNTVIAARDTEKAQEVIRDAQAQGVPGKVIAVAADVTDLDSVDAMFAAALKAFGSIDVLVNNSGGVAAPGPFEEQKPEDAQWEFALNIRGVCHCSRAAAKHMLAQGSGSIINISSNSSLLGEAGNNVANYAGCKGYVNSLTKALAYEWAGRGVRVNNIAPGWIVPWEADQVSSGSFWERFGFELFGTPEEMARQAAEGALFNMQNQPIKRVGRPEDIAALALFFASEVSSFITGCTVSVSGGVYMP